MFLSISGPRLESRRGGEQGVIKPLRGDDLPRRHSRNLQSGIHVFAFSLVFQYCGPLVEPFRGDVSFRHA